MIFPPLPEPTVIDGRRLYTAGDMRSYGQACADAERARLESVEHTDTKTPDSADIDWFLKGMGMKK